MAKSKAAVLVAEPQIGHVSDLKGDSEIQDIVTSIAGMNGELAVYIPDTDEELADQIATNMVRDARHMASTALQLAALKARAGHGKWLPMLAARGINDRTAQRYLQLAQFLMALPAAARPKYLGSPITKVSALTQLDAEDIAAAQKSGELDEWLAMPKSELVEHVRKLTRTNAGLETKVETRDAAIEKMRHQLAHRLDHLEMPSFAAAAREEAAALTEKMAACLNSITDVAKTSLFVEREEVEAEKFQNKVAGTIFHSLLAIVAQGHELLLEIQGIYPHVEAGVKFDFQLVKLEAKHYQKIRAAILEQHAKEAKNREAERENAKPGKRGRKRAVEA